MGQKINPVLKRILQIMQQTEKAARIFEVDPGFRAP
jgi:hypothetical protein